MRPENATRRSWRSCPFPVRTTRRWRRTGSRAGTTWTRSRSSVRSSPDTNHDEVIGHATAQKLTDVSLERDTPVTLGVTGPGMSGAEARERVENAASAVDSALDLVAELEDA